MRESVPGYVLQSDRASWEAAADSRDDLRRRAGAVLRLARGVGATSMCSYGVGAAALELHIARADPELRLICTDLAPRAVGRLQELFPEADVRCHDLLADQPVAADLHLLHRVDTEFDDEDWRRVLARFDEPVLLVIDDFLHWHEVVRSVGNRRRGNTYLRSESAWRRLWSRTHRAERHDVAGLTGFLLSRR